MTPRAKRYFSRKRERKFLQIGIDYNDGHSYTMEFCMTSDVEKAVKEANRKFWESVLTEPYLRSIK